MTVTITNPDLNVIADFQRSGKAFKWTDGKCYKITEVQGEMDADAISVSLTLFQVYCGSYPLERVLHDGH